MALPALFCQMGDLPIAQNLSSMTRFLLKFLIRAPVVVVSTARIHTFLFAQFSWYFAWYCWFGYLGKARIKSPLLCVIQSLLLNIMEYYLKTDQHRWKGEVYDPSMRWLLEATLLKVSIDTSCIPNTSHRLRFVPKFHHLNMFGNCCHCLDKPSTTPP